MENTEGGESLWELSDGSDHGQDTDTVEISQKASTPELCQGEISEEKVGTNTVE